MTEAVITNRCVLLETVGQGGMRIVHKVHDRLTGDIVALKQITLSPNDGSQSAETSEWSDFRLALTREFRTLSGLRHSNIISVLDYGYDQDHIPFYTMEFIQSPTNIVEADHSQSMVGKVNLIIKLLPGLSYLHRHNIIHRDLKPDNIFVGIATR